MNRLSAPSDQIPEERLWQTETSLAVTGRVGGDSGQALIATKPLVPVDGLIARVVLGKNLREHDAQRDPRGVESFSPGMIAVTTFGLNELRIQEIEKGKALLAAELISQGIELGLWRRGDRLVHGDLLGVATGGSVEPPVYAPRRSLYFPSKSVCHNVNYSKDLRQG
jgi:hypothetical protein